MDDHKRWHAQTVYVLRLHSSPCSDICFPEIDFLHFGSMKFQKQKNSFEEEKQTPIGFPGEAECVCMLLACVRLQNNMPADLHTSPTPFFIYI